MRAANGVRMGSGMSKPVLTYFNFSGGRGEAARIALHITGVDWVDDRFTGKWPDKKPSTPFGGLPLLEVPGKGVISQSNAILGYIGREHGLLPDDAWEEARHVAVLNAVEDLRAQASTTARDDEQEKKEAREAFAAGYFAKWLGNLSDEIRGPFVGGDELSVADIKVYVAMRAYPKGVYDHIPTDVLEPFPKVTALMKAVEAHPRVAEWIAKKA